MSDTMGLSTENTTAGIAFCGESNILWFAQRIDRRDQQSCHCGSVDYDTVDCIDSEYCIDNNTRDNRCGTLSGRGRSGEIR